MPPKSKIIKKPTPQILPQAMSNIQNTKSGLDPEAEDRFELELCWCIQQIETTLTTTDMQPKQAESALKTLNVLKSKNSSLIKKRQLMRNMFGDYRQKMADDEKKFGKAVTFKFTPLKKNSRKSVFLKKAGTNSLLKTVIENESVDNEKKSTCTENLNLKKDKQDFKFNFAISETK